MVLEQRDRLSHAIIKHLHALSSDGHVVGDSAESLAVACQCLSEALGVDVNNATQTQSLGVDKSLQEIFDDVYPTIPVKSVSKDDEVKANSLKDEGNDLMRQNKYEEAIVKYSSAIELSANAIFFCNRAAAYSKVARHAEAVEDSKSALNIDDQYSKAYARMGFAYLNMHKYEEAKSSYENALNIDPTNQSYKDNLDAVKEKLAAGPPNSIPGMTPDMGPMGGYGAGGAGGMAGMPNFGNIDFSQIMSNPAFMNMAQQFMTDPNMQQAFGQMAEQFMQSGAVPQSGQNMDLSAMMNDPALRQMAENFEAQNPDMIDNLRRNFEQPPEDDGTDPAV